MKTPAPHISCFAAFALLVFALPAFADPLLTSWLTGTSTKYARIYTSAANRTNGVSATTWTGQTSPTYAGVHEVDYSATWVYIRNTGLAPYVMGPWNNPNLPHNQGTSTGVYRFPRTPVVPGTKTLTGMGSIGFLVDGVSMYNTSDGYSYSVSHAQDADPIAGIGNGDGIWNRDAYPNEGGSFDYALNHPQPSGQYHSHANPIAVRYELGDNVNYNSTSKAYSENTATTVFKHSPIIGWANDGLPLYGPYGYDGGSTGATGVAALSGGTVASVSVSTGGSLYQSPPAVAFSGGGGTGASATAVLTGGVVTSVNMISGGSGYTSIPAVTIGGVRRMVSGYVKRDGGYGTTNLASTGRTTLPAWAALAQGRSATLSSGQYGPATTYTSGTGNNALTYTLGHYAEDYDYLGDLGFTQGYTTTVGAYTTSFDLNKYNARYCVTPEYPSGTWAYFTSILADGTPWYPYTVGRWYYGSPTGGASTTTVMATDGATLYYKGAASTVENWVSAPVGVSGGNVTITWNAVEGGTYQVSSSGDLVNWTPLTPTVSAIGNSGTMTDTGAATANSSYFFKVSRTSLATYDTTGY